MRIKLNHIRRGGALLALAAVGVSAGCGAEARSETEIPAFVAEVPAVEPASYLHQPVAVEPAPADEIAADPVPSDPPAAPEPVAPRDEPVLVATDTDGRQRVDFEVKEDIEAPTEPEAPVAAGAINEEDPTDEAEGSDAEFGEEADLEPAPPAIEEPFIEAGQELTFTVEAEVNTKEARPGDVFYAYLTDDLVAADGMVLLPRGVRARGRVVEAFASEDSEELPILEVVLEELIGPEGDTPIAATVVEAAVEGEARDSDGESVVKVLTGAAAGAILGRILGGDDEDAVKGGLAGAAAGAAVAYGSRGGHAKIPAGGLITVRLEQPLTVF